MRRTGTSLEAPPAVGQRIGQARVVAGAASGRWSRDGRAGEVSADFSFRAPATDPEVLSAGGSAAGRISTEPGLLAAQFPGRWNPRRALPAGLDGLVVAFAGALGGAGWWTPGQEAPVDGGLVLGTDYQYLSEAAGYAGDLRRLGPAGTSPTGFLFSLPSSAAAVVGILFGLRDYQATLVGGGRAGFQALAHAADRIACGRGQRLVTGALSRVAPACAAALKEAEGIEPEGDPGTLELAVALCLESTGAREGAGGAPAVTPEWDSAGAHSPELTASVLGDLPAVFHPLAAPSLLALLCRLREARGSFRIRHAGPREGAIPDIRVHAGEHHEGH